MEKNKTQKNKNMGMFCVKQLFLCIVVLFFMINNAWSQHPPLEYTNEGTEMSPTMQNVTIASCKAYCMSVVKSTGYEYEFTDFSCTSQISITAAGCQELTSSAVRLARTNGTPITEETPEETPEENPDETPEENPDETPGETPETPTRPMTDEEINNLNQQLADEARQEMEAAAAAVAKCGEDGGRWSTKTRSCKMPDNCFYPPKPSKFVEEMSQVCWFCEPLRDIIKIIETIAKEVYAKVMPATLSLLGALFLVWIAIKILAFVGSMELKDGGEFFTDLLFAAGRTIIAAVAINESDAIWEHVIGPIADVAFVYSQEALRIASSGITIAGDTIKEAGPISDISDRIVGNDPDEAGGILALINKNLMQMIATGWVVVTLSMNLGWFCLPFTEFLLFFSGLLLIIMGCIFLFVIPFKAIDICFRFAVFLILLPLFILGWVFPATRFFTKGGIDILVNMFGTLLTYAIVVALCTQIVIDSLGLPTLTDNMKTTEDNVARFYNATISSIIISIAFVVFSLEILKVTSAMADQLFGRAGTDSGIAGGASRGAMLLTKATTALGGAAGKYAGAKAQSKVRDATAGTKYDAQTRAHSDRMKAQSLVNEHLSASKGGFSASPHGLKEVKMPPSVAKALKADPNYKLTKDDVAAVIKENRYRNKGIKGFIQDYKTNKKNDLKEKFYSKLTGEEASKYY